jgi:hypothetical protein
MNLMLALALISGGPWTPPPGYNYWIGAIDTYWSNPDGNWSTPYAPNGVGVKLLFGHDFDHPEYRTLVDMQETSRTVGDLIFVQDRPIAIQGAKLTLDNGANPSTLDISGPHTISAPVELNNDALIEGSGTLNLTGGISGNYVLTVVGNLTAKSIQVDTLSIGGSGMQNAVPESGVIALLFTGALGGLAWRRNRNRLLTDAWKMIVKYKDRR